MALNQVTRGDTKKWSIAVVDDNGNPFDLSGCTVWFTAKSAISNQLDDSDAVISHKLVVDGSGNPTLSNGFTIGGIHPVTGSPASGAASGVLTHTLSAADSTLLAPGSYIYDLQVKTADGEVYTPILGQTLTVVEDVTRSIT